MSAELVNHAEINGHRPDDGASLGLAADVDFETNALLADNLLRLIRITNRLRAAMANAQGDESEWMQNHVLFQLASSGPVRASVLAESVEADPSTVSRQVASLVRSGLIERRSDPDDGRASLLALTATGKALHQRHLERRDGHYARMLREWSAADRRTLAELLDRFATDFDSYKSEILAEACAARTPASREEHQ